MVLGTLYLPLQVCAPTIGCTARAGVSVWQLLGFEGMALEQSPL